MLTVLPLIGSDDSECNKKSSIQVDSFAEVNRMDRMAPERYNRLVNPMSGFAAV